MKDSSHIAPANGGQSTTPFASRRNRPWRHVLPPAVAFLLALAAGATIDFENKIESALQSIDSVALHRLVFALVLVLICLAWSAFALALAQHAAATHARKTELASNHLRERLQQFVDVGADWLWETGPDQRLTYVSERVEETLHMPPKQLVGQIAWDLFAGNEAERARFRHQRDEVEGGLPLRDLVFPLRDGAGQLRYLRINGDPIVDAEGRYLGHRGVASDVTAQIESERRADAAHRRLIDAVESMPAAIMLFDADERLVLWNSRAGLFYPELRDLFLVGTPYPAFIKAGLERGVLHAEHQADRDWADRRLANFRAAPSAELQRLANGRWLHSIDCKTSDGGTVCVSTDVTDLKTHEQELAVKTDLLHTTLENMDQGLSVIDRDLKLVAWNDRFLQLLDFPREFAQFGKPLEDFFRYNAERGDYGPGDAATLVAQRMADAKKFAPHTFERTRPDGTVLEVRGKPLPGGGFVTTYTDVTDRRATELQLRQAQKMESVGQMAGGVAHEFNNLLTAIGGFGRMALRRLDDTEHVRDCLGEVLTAADRAADVTRQLLAFSRKQVLDPVLVSIADVVNDTSSMLRPLLGETIRLTLAIEPLAADVLVDRGQLSQVIVNLAINARDAMPDGGELTIGSGIAQLPRHIQNALSGAEQPYALLWVTDTGSGMDDRTKQKIFEPFFTTKEPGKGTGLGLAVVLGIVEQSGGFIDVDSQLGAGSNFRIYLPLVENAQAIKPAASDAAVPVAAARPATVLLVEDEDAVRRLLHTQLEEMGYEVLTATNGQEALRVARTFAQPIDLLLTDVVMPQMGGLEAARRLAADRPDLKVVYITGYRHRGDADTTGLDPGAHVLPKPFDEGQLSETIRKALAS